MVAAAAAAAEVLSASPNSQSGADTTASSTGLSSPPSGRQYRGNGATDTLPPLTVVGDDHGATGAVGVEFSSQGCLLAVALVDGTVLLTRVERYTRGIR